MYDNISIAAILSYFLPLIIVLFKGLWRDRFFLFFAIYWLIGGLSNVIDLPASVPADTKYAIGVLYNMLDIPMVLAILYYTSTSGQLKKYLSVAFIAVVAMQCLGLVFEGFGYGALKYPLGTGILLVLAGVVWEIVGYLRQIEHSNRQTATVFVYAALLFEYGTYILIYIFDYFITASVSQDSFLIYYISTLVAIVIASCGFLMFRKHEKESPAF